jgi:type IV pilus assembly protein PilV
MKSKGFSLIEVLVAVLVLAIGLLGVAALQINATRANQSAELRSQASMLAYFILDAMRANREAAISGAYNTESYPEHKLCEAPSSPSTLAEKDQEAWLKALKHNLVDQPSTCGEIACNIDTCTVKVYWDDSRAGGASNQVIEVKSRL